MITIRLSRTGKHKAPQYRIVVQDKTRDPWGAVIEILGHYNPRRTPSEIVINKERAEYWISKGAQASATVHNLLVDQGILKADKARAVTVSKKRQTKIDETREAKAAAKAEAEEKAAAEKVAAEEAAKAEAEAAKEAAKAEAEAAKAAAEAEKTAAEAPAEEAAPEATPEAEAPATEEPATEEKEA